MIVKLSGAIRLCGVIRLSPLEWKSGIFRMDWVQLLSMLTRYLCNKIQRCLGCLIVTPSCHISQGDAGLNQRAFYTESFKLHLAYSPPKNQQLLIGLQSNVMRKCFIQGHFGHSEIHATSPADCLQSYPKCPPLCNDFSRQLTGPVRSRHSTDFT